MRYLYIILLALFSFSLKGQELLFLFENNANDAMGLHNATAYGDIVYSTSKVLQGTYSCNVYNTGARFSTNNTVDLTSGGMTISFGLHYFNESGLPVIATNMATASSNGWAVYFDRDNKRIGYFVRNGANTGWAYSANNSIPNTDTWYYVTVAVTDVTGQYAKIFINGVASGTDTTTVSGGGPANSAVHIGCFGDGGATLFDRVDKFSIHKCRLPDADIVTNYNNRTSANITECPSGEYSVSGYRPKYNGVLFTPKFSGATFNMKTRTYTEAPPTPPSGETMIDILGRGTNAYGVVSSSDLTPQFTSGEWDAIAEHFDHVRLVLYNFAHSGSDITTTTLNNLTTLVNECVNRGMVAVIDYHSPAWTSSYTEGNINTYLNDWTQIADHLNSYDTTEVVYELVNEPHYSLTLNQWNDLAARAVDSIRAYDANKYIMVSPGYWAGVKGLYDFVLPDDDKLIVSLHYYNPRTLTHQCASWVDLADTWCGTPWYAIQPFMDEITKDFAYVDTWLAANGNPPLHIGEIGVYNLADDSTARAPYLNYLTRWIESKGWSWCIWDFKQDFGVYTAGDYISVIEDALFVDPMPEPLPYDSTTIYEADFTSTTDGWGCFDSDGTTSTSEATLSVSGGELVVTINTPGSSTSDIRIGHTVNLVQGKMYRLSYTIRSTSNRSVLPVRVGTRMFSQEEYNVGSDGRTTVVSRYYSDINHSGAKITFDIGGSSATFYISDLKWEELTLADPLEGFEILEYWDFENQTLGNFTEAEIESYFTGSSAYIDAGHEDKLNIVTEALNGNASNKCLQLTYPAETFSQLYHWDYPLNSGSGYSEVYVSMNIKYGDDDMTNWSSSGGGKNFGFKGYPWSAWTATDPQGNPMPDTDEGFYVVPMFTPAGQFTHYFYNHWDDGQGNNYNYPSYGTNANYAIPGTWFNLTMRAKMNSTASTSDGILEIFFNGVPMYQYNNYRFYEDASLMSNLIDVIEFTHFFGGASDNYKMDETAYIYWDDIVVWMPETPTVGLTSGTLDLPYEVTGETYPYQTLITTEQTFTNSEYGSSYSPQVTEAWLIDAGAGNTVTLTVNAIDLDDDTYAQNDMVKIYDGNVPGSDLIGRHGSAISTNYPTVGNSCTSTGRYMYVIFESDRNGQVGTGFQMTVTFN